MKKIKPMNVDRCDLGYWTHPDYFEPANNNEYGFPGEFEAWLAEQGLEHSVISLECDDVSEELAEKYDDGALDGDISAWNPSRPDGEGWFIGSIHDTEDGPYCIWLRSKGSLMTNKTEIAVSPNCILSIEQALYCVGKDNRPHIQKAIMDRLSSLSSQLEAAKAEIADLEKDCMRLKSVINTEASRAESAEAMNGHLDLAVRKAEGVSEALRRKAETAENRIIELEGERDRALKAGSAVRKEFDAQYARAEKAEAKLAALRGDGNSNQWRMDIINMRNLLASNEWAEHVAKTPSGSGLEAEITKLVSELPELRGAALPVHQVLLDDAWVDVSSGAMESQKKHGIETRILFTHPAPPVVVLEDCSIEAVSHMAHWYSNEQCEAWVAGCDWAVKKVREAGITVKSADGEGE